MLTPDEAARAKAEVALSDFLETVHEAPDYWHDLDIGDNALAEINAWAHDSPEQATSTYFLHSPRWVEGAKCYAATVIEGLADTHLRPDSPVPATEAVSAFRKAYESLTCYLWDEHFKGLASEWNSLYRPRWQSKLPDFAIPKIDKERFAVWMSIWDDHDRYRPEQLVEEFIAGFWADRAEVVRGPDAAPLSLDHIQQPRIERGTLPQMAKPAETIAAQLNKLRTECRWSIESLAEAVHLDPRSVSRHISGKSAPHLSNLGTYERVFSKELGRKVVIEKTPGKRR